MIVAIIILLRPYFPSLPFHVGNTVLIAGLFGKVESSNMYHTKLKTFDGKLVFIPNSKIMADVVVNYHATKGQRIRINVRIPYEADLVRAKQVLEAVMIADPRVLKSPRPTVWTLNLDGGSVELGARCWADNDKYWLTKCDLTEKIKLRLEHEGIRMAVARHQVQFQHQPFDEPDQSETAGPFSDRDVDSAGDRISAHGSGDVSGDKPAARE